MQSFGLKATRFDNDVWIRLSSDGKTYEYICIHVDDFCIFSRDPQSIMELTKSIFTVKAEGTSVMITKPTPKVYVVYWMPYRYQGGNSSH